MSKTLRTLLNINSKNNKDSLETMKTKAKNLGLELTETNDQILIGRELLLGKNVVAKYTKTNDKNEILETKEMEKILRTLVDNKGRTIPLAEQMQHRVRFMSAITIAQEHLKSITRSHPSTMTPNTAWSLLKATGALAPSPYRTPEEQQSSLRLATRLTERIGMTNAAVLHHAMELIYANAEEQVIMNGHGVAKWLSTFEANSEYMDNFLREIQTYRATHSFPNSVSALYHQKKHHREFAPYVPVPLEDPEMYHSVVIPLMRQDSNVTMKLSRDGRIVNREWKKVVGDPKALLFMSTMIPFETIASRLGDRMTKSSLHDFFDEEKVATAYVKG